MKECSCCKGDCPICIKRISAPPDRSDAASSSSGLLSPPPKLAGNISTERDYEACESYDEIRKDRRGTIIWLIHSLFPEEERRKIVFDAAKSEAIKACGADEVLLEGILDSSLLDMLRDNKAHKSEIEEMGGLLRILAAFMQRQRFAEQAWRSDEILTKHTAELNAAKSGAKTGFPTKAGHPSAVVVLGAGGMAPPPRGAQDRADTTSVDLTGDDEPGAAPAPEVTGEGKQIVLERVRAIEARQAEAERVVGLDPSTLTAPQATGSAVPSYLPAPKRRAISRGEEMLSKQQDDPIKETKWLELRQSLREEIDALHSKASL